MPEKIIINDVEIKKGQQAQIALNIARLPTHTMIDLPINVYRAKEDGPVLLLTAGLHGDEINGIETIRRLIVQKKVLPECGTVIAIPIVNVYGFIHNSRKFPDGKDLNRSFPGSQKGSLASLIAHILTKDILPYVDLGVDFHTGGANKMNYPHIRCNLDVPENVDFARRFAPPFIVNSKAPDHSFRKAAAQLGKPILTFEGGESLRLHELSISEGVSGVMRLMKSLSMRQDEVGRSEPRILRGSWWNRAKQSGIFQAKIDIGDNIKRNQLLGYITDPFGESIHRVKANKDGFVIGLNYDCVINKGEALIHLGTVE